MEAVILIGLQGSGKSTFYRRHYFDTHLRLSLDMLRTRNREKRLLAVCIETSLRFVVDNTNPTRAERQVYIQAARAAGYRIVGHYFQSRVDDCQLRNAERPVRRQVPFKGLLGTAARMERPALREGFDRLEYVWIDDDRNFHVEEWIDEDP